MPVRINIGMRARASRHVRVHPWSVHTAHMLRVRAGFVLIVGALTLTACSVPELDSDVSLTNGTHQTIRITGDCTEDDAFFMSPGQTVTAAFYADSYCRIDNGDGLDGMLGCVRLTSAHTTVTLADLRRPPGPNDCWTPTTPRRQDQGGGSRSPSQARGLRNAATLPG